ncbi:MAG: hypothetical protein HY584_03005, partial [Candidatus Omnitrophica bacterium]|nr:hypothetical protein [Candidatus Omnitrophota bacterium]
NPDKMRISVDGGITWGSGWIDYISNPQVTLTGSDGLKAVRVEFQDKASNLSSGLISDTITLDTTLPTGTITIAGGSDFTKTALVQLTLTQAEVNPDKMRISVDGGITWGSGWIDYISNPQVTLTGSDGLKAVRVEFRDKAQNVSTALIADTITLDTTPPEGTVTINDNAQYTKTTSINLTLTYTEANGIQEMCFSESAAGPWNVCSGYSDTSPFTLSSGDNTKTVYVRLKDQAGLYSTQTQTISDSITLDTRKAEITNVNHNSNLTSNSAVMTWMTDEDSDSLVEYGLTQSYGSPPVSNASFRKDHSLAINNLQANTTYYYQVKSKDQAGNISIPYQGNFTTQGQVQGTTFADDFNRSTVGTNWTPAQASFSIDSTQALTHLCCTSPGVLLYNGALASNDYDLIMDTFYTDAMAARGLVARYQDSANYYMAKVGRDGDARIFKVAGGVQTQLGPTYDGPWFTASTWHQLKFSVQGSNLNFYVDGVLRVSVQDSTFTSGKVGIRSDTYYTRFDNFTITAPGTQPPLTAPAVNPVSSYTNQTTLTLSGTKQPNTSVWINGVEKVTANSSTIWSAPVTMSAQGSYTFSVTTKNTLANQSSPITVSTTLDTINPKITSTAAPSTVTSTTATITWITDEQTDSVIEYGTTSSLGLSTSNSSYVTNHSWTIRNRTDGTTYYWRVRSKDRAGNTVYSAISTFKTLTTTEATASFQESGGLLAMEGENYHTRIARNGKTWDTWASVQGFSGSGYPFATPGCCVNQDTGYTTMSPELQYKINIQTSGTYYVWVRGFAWDQWSDSFHVGLDGVGLSTSDRIKYPSSMYGAFNWTNQTFDGPRATIDITTPGEHILNLWMSDDGTFLDKIILTQDPNFTPTSYGPPENGRTGSTITVNPPTVNALPQYTNQSSITLSGTKPANTSVWINDVLVWPLDSGTTWSYLAPLTEGANSFSIVAKDSTGNPSTVVSRSTTLDTVLPEGTATVAGGSDFTKTALVQLTLTQAEVNPDKMRISVD